MQDRGLEVVEVGLDDLLDPLGCGLLEALDLQLAGFRGVVVADPGLEREVLGKDLLHQ